MQAAAFSSTFRARNAVAFALDAVFGSKIASILYVICGAETGHIRFVRYRFRLCRYCPACPLRGGGGFLTGEKRSEDQAESSKAVGGTGVGGRREVAMEAVLEGLGAASVG
eukprot:2075030-Rhodomonas_salina.3